MDPEEETWRYQPQACCIDCNAFPCTCVRQGKNFAQEWRWRDRAGVVHVLLPYTAEERISTFGLARSRIETTKTTRWQPRCGAYRPNHRREDYAGMATCLACITGGQT